MGAIDAADAAKAYAIAGAGLTALSGSISWLLLVYDVGSLLRSRGAGLCALSSLGPAGALAKAEAGLSRGQGNL